MSKQGRAASQRIREMQARQRAAERRRRSMLVGGLVVVAVALIVGIGIAVQANRSNTTGSSAAPAGVVDTYGVPRGDPSALVEVIVYEDFQCPVCKAFEEQYVGGTVTRLVDRKQISVQYRPIAFLDDKSTTDYSSRALETAACSLDEAGPDVFLSLHDLLFANQPQEGTAGLSDGALADLAAKAGADKGKVAACQSDGTFAGWAADATDAASKAGVTGTPTYLVDGQQVTFTNQEAPKVTLTNAIQAAKP